MLALLYVDFYQTFTYEFDNMNESFYMTFNYRKCSCAGEEAQEETHSEDPGVLSGGRGLNRPQEEGIT